MTAGRGRRAQCAVCASWLYYLLPPTNYLFYDYQSSSRTCMGQSLGHSRCGTSYLQVPGRW